MHFCNWMDKMKMVSFCTTHMSPCVIPWFWHHMFVQEFNGSLKAGKLHHGVWDLPHPEWGEALVEPVLWDRTGFSRYCTACKNPNKTKIHQTVSFFSPKPLPHFVRIYNKNMCRCQMCRCVSVHVLGGCLWFSVYKFLPLVNLLLV